MRSLRRDWAYLGWALNRAKQRHVKRWLSGGVSEVCDERRDFRKVLSGGGEVFCEGGWVVGGWYVERGIGC